MKNGILKILKELYLNNIDCVICGGVACILQGCERSTFDLDVYISLNKDNLQKAVDLFKRLNYKPRIPEPLEALLDPLKREFWIKQKNALVYTVVSESGDFQIDIFLDYCIDYGNLKNNSDKFDIEGIEISVSSKQDLIKAKNAVIPLRDKDIYDIKQLEGLIKSEK